MMNFFKTFYKVNKFPIQSFKRYYKYSSKYEILSDILLPFIISVVLSYLFWRLGTTSGIFEAIDKINNPVLAAVSILAGFNVASITVLASTQSNIIDYLRRTQSDKYPNTTLFEMLMGYFSWAIAVQLIVIFIGFILIILTSFLDNKITWDPVYFHLFWIGFVGWSTIILHSIFVSLRNLKYLYVFLTSKIEEDN